ncbi:MAG: PUA domain-containing protein [Opitutales bacterium]
MLDESVFALAGGATGSGTGGMTTKLKAAEMALAAGCTTHITSGHGESPISDALEGKRLHTTIASNTNPQNARLLWISTSIDILGTLYIEEEQIDSILGKRSIFPEDIVKCEGEFNRGDIVSIISNGRECARGIISFNTKEVHALIEQRSPDIFSVLGYKTRRDFVFKSDLAPTAVQATDEEISEQLTQPPTNLQSPHHQTK